jgi:hypothetical protein
LRGSAAEADRSSARVGHLELRSEAEFASALRADTLEQFRADGCGRLGRQAGLLTLDRTAGQRLGFVSLPTAAYSVVIAAVEADLDRS